MTDWRFVLIVLLVKIFGASFRPITRFNDDDSHTNVLSDINQAVKALKTWIKRSFFFMAL